MEQRTASATTSINKMAWPIGLSALQRGPVRPPLLLASELLNDRFEGGYDFVALHARLGELQRQVEGLSGCDSLTQSRLARAAPARSVAVALWKSGIFAAGDPGS